MSFYSNEENGKTEGDVSSRYLEFNLGTERYACELLSVLEVISVPETTPVPNSPTYLEGVMNLRGQIVTIIDLRKKLNITPKEENKEQAVIILNVEGHHLGVIVDSINKVLNVTENSVSDSADVQGQSQAKYINGIHKEDDELVFILDFYKLLNISEIKNVA